MSGNKIVFPRGFVFGAGTSAFQIEGAWNKDGKGESIWDRFCHSPGNIANGDTGDNACDHYNRYDTDIDMMAQLGLKAYRFSISWPGVLPTGRHRQNQAGLDFYDRLVDRLLEHEIAPFVTLFHWDLPQLLQDKGGWMNRDVGDYFAEYCALIAAKLGDRVKHFATLNEPQAVALLGYGAGIHAPGQKDILRVLQVSHNLLVAHGKAVTALRETRSDLNVGIILDMAS